MGLNLRPISRHFDFPVVVPRIPEVLGARERQSIGAHPLHLEGFAPALGLGRILGGGRDAVGSDAVHHRSKGVGGVFSVLSVRAKQLRVALGTRAHIDERCGTVELKLVLVIRLPLPNGLDELLSGVTRESLEIERVTGGEGRDGDEAMGMAEFRWSALRLGIDAAGRGKVAEGHGAYRMVLWDLVRDAGSVPSRLRSVDAGREGSGRLVDEPSFKVGLADRRRLFLLNRGQKRGRRRRDGRRRLGTLGPRDLF